MAAKVPEAVLSAACALILARLTGDDGVDVSAANVGAIEAVALVDLGDAWVAGLGKDDVNTRVQGGAVHGQLNDLDGGLVAGGDAGPLRQRHLWQAYGPGVGVLARPPQLEHGPHRVRHVRGPAIGSVGAEAQVDVCEGSLVALEPTGLPSDGAACRRPVSPILCCWNATARIHPLHAVGEGFVGDEVVPSPSRIGYDTVGGGERREGESRK